MRKATMGGISIVRNSDVSRQQFHVRFVEDLLSESHAFFFMHAVIISHDSSRILSAMLQMNYTVIEFSCDRFMGIYTSDTAH